MKPVTILKTTYLVTVLVGLHLLYFGFTLAPFYKAVQGVLVIFVYPLWLVLKYAAEVGGLYLAIKGAYRLHMLMKYSETLASLEEIFMYLQPGGENEEPIQPETTGTEEMAN